MTARTESSAHGSLVIHSARIVSAGVVVDDGWVRFENGVVTARGVTISDKARDLVAALKTSAQKRLADFTLIPPEEHHALLASLTKQETRL